jgi:hypothetical protein
MMWFPLFIMPIGETCERHRGQLITLDAVDSLPAEISGRAGGLPGSERSASFAAQGQRGRVRSVLPGDHLGRVRFMANIVFKDLRFMCLYARYDEVDRAT